MKITLDYDDIIYQLQHAGGVSTYWKEITSRVVTEETIKVRRTKGNRITRYLPLFSQADIFHSSYYRINLSARSKNIVTVYDFVYELGFLKTLGSSVNIMQRKLAINTADAIICISDNTKKDLLLLYPHLASHPHIYVVSLAASFTVDNSSNLNISDRLLKLEKHRINHSILFIGKRLKYKNFNAVIVGFSESSLPKQGYTLVCIGTKFSDKEELLIASLGMEKHVLVIENTSEKELNYLYQNAFALVYPSLYEGFGLPPLEAMSCGCPVIASNSSSIPEVVGDSGILLDSPDPTSISIALEQLLDENVRKAFISKGLTRAKLFTWDKAAKNHIQIYKSILNEGKK